MNRISQNLLLTVLEQVEQLEGKTSASTAQLTELQKELSTSTSQSAELRSLHEAQSRELHVSTSSGETKDLIIASLTADVERLKSEVTQKDKHLSTALEQAEKIQQELSISASRLADLQSLHDKQLLELTTAHHEFQREVAQKAERLEQLQHDISTSSAQLADLQNHYDEQSRELTAARNELHKSTSSIETKDHTIASITAKLEESRGAGDKKDEQVAMTLEQVEKLKQELSTSTSQLTELQSLYEERSREVTAVRDELETFRISDSKKTKEFATASKDLERLRRDLDTSTSQIKTLEHLDATKIEELTTARNDLEKLRRDLSSASSQITEFQQRCAVHSSQLEQWKGSDAAKATELTAVLNAKIEKLQREGTDKTHELARAHSNLEQLQHRLNGVQRFVTTADTHADTVIVQMLRKLNAEVQQNTSFIAECILDDFQPPLKTLTKEQTPTTKRVSESIGETLADCLRREDPDELALYLPIAFQAYLAYHLCGIISSWTIEKGHSDLINAIYQRLQEEGMHPSFECNRLAS